MERYVWELTKELNKLGHHVTVICERCHVEKPAGIDVYELGEIAVRPRWLAQLRFSRRVTAWLKAHPSHGLIHSHERMSGHQITTFHGPPFATIYEKSFWRLLSIRVWARLYLEWRELVDARAIVPNSEFIKRQLQQYYPHQQSKLTSPVVPGVRPTVKREWHNVADGGGIIAFVGKEWQRKGLSLVVEIVAVLKHKRPQLELWVIGPEPSAVQHLFSGWQSGYRLMGWRKDMEYLREVDVLLHPAKAEPYGMVISEAMAACVPVVVSDVCGAAIQVGETFGQVLPLSAPASMWSAAVEKELVRTEPSPQFVFGWDEVAKKYEQIYEQAVQNSPHDLIGKK